MNWSVAITETATDSFHEDLKAAFAHAYPDPPEAVEDQFAELAGAADKLVRDGHLGEAPFQATLQGYVSEPGDGSTSNSVGFSIIGTVPGE